MTWRFYARRATSNKWLDTNVQIDPIMRWSLNRSFSGQALLSNGLNLNKAPDGRDVWGRGDTILLGEEDGKLMWGGICNIASPGRDGLYLEFTGAVGWWNNVPFDDYLEMAQADVFDVVRRIASHANAKPRTLNVTVSDDKSQFTAGGTRGDYPEQPVRPAGMTTQAYENSPQYRAWVAKIAKYEEGLGVGPYTLAWWEAPYVGEEINTLADEYGFGWRERVRWEDRANLIPQFRMDVADDLTRRRDDIVFEDGVNLASNNTPKEDTEPYADAVIGLGAGEGRDMLRAEVASNDDDRLYAAQYVNYKTVTRKERLTALSRNDLRRLRGEGATIESVRVWDTPGFAPLSSLMVGDECRVVSYNAKPPYDIWHRVTEITRQPSSGVVELALERRD